MKRFKYWLKETFKYSEAQKAALITFVVYILSFTNILYSFPPFVFLNKKIFPIFVVIFAPAIIGLYFRRKLINRVGYVPYVKYKDRKIN